MHLNLGDNELVRQVIRKAYPDYSGRKIEIKYNVKSINLNSYWQDGSRNYFVVMELSTMKVLQVNQNGSVYDKINVDKFIIPVGFIVIEHTIFCGKDLGITIHVSESPVIENRQDNDLSELDYHVLIATCAYKSSYAGISDYRFYELKNKYHYKLQDVLNSRMKLQSMGYLDKRNAITNTGKNLIANHPDRYH